ncbi:sensor histidine kinase [Micromonospora sp. BQ11]|uniref:sensor histidine kinase n=1 Tax=Micromonospora sp. BQ11 TaxID=3452212 RepID=UPI003F8C0C5C
METVAGCVGRPWKRTAVAAAVSTSAVGVLVATSLWAATRSGPATTLPLDVTLAVVGVALVPVVVRRPEVGGVLAGLLVGLSPVVTPVASFAVLWTARHRPFRPALAVTIAGLTGEAVLGRWRPVAGLPYGWWFLLIAAAFAALLGWGTWARARHALVAALRDRARRAEREQERRVAEARAGERNRIAREMHDVLAHRLSLLAAAAGAMEYRPDASPERLSAAAGVVRASAQQALAELREVVTLLRSDDADSDPPANQTLADLPHLLAEARAAGQRIETDDRLAAPDAIPATLSRTAYHIVREALTNARRHATGQPVLLTLAGAPGGHLTVSVRNPTSGRATMAGDPGTGLIGLAERAAVAGGSVTHHVDDSGCFHLTGRLPWPT